MNTIRQKITAWVLAGVFAALAGGAAFSVATPVATPVSAAACGGGSFLGFPAWHRGLTENVKGNCTVKSPAKVKGGLQVFIWTIVLNVIEMALRIVGLVAVGFVMYGGFKYITSTGSSDGMAKAKSTILNALIGLGLSVASVGIVNVAAGVVSGSTSTRSGVRNLPTQSADSVLAGVLGTIYTWAGIACVIVIVVAGFYYATSQGNAAQVGRAKSAIIAAIVGLAVILMAFAITQFVLGGIL